MSLELIVWLTAGVIFLAILLAVAIVRRKQNYFVEANIPGPPPTFLFGNLRKLWQASNYFRQLETWTRQYGRVYGMFEGTLPIYVVSDVDFLEQVLIKQFTNFDRRKPVLFLMPGQEKRISVFDAVGATWRRQRYVLKPTYSKAKLTEMLPLISGCMDELIHALAPYADSNVEVDVNPVYFRMSMDAIFRCGFSFDTDVQRDSNNMYLKKLRSFVGTENRKLLFVKLAATLPAIGGFILQVTMRVFMLLHKLHAKFPYINFPELPLLWLFDRIGEHVIRVRKDTNEHSRVDLLHLMMNAVTDQTIVDEEVPSDGNMSSLSPSVSVKKLTTDEILGNVSIFLLGATEMVAVLLSYCTYVLATHPEVQKKLQDEIDANITNDVQSPTYEMIEKLEYLDIFIKEVTRMYPISALVMNRLCVQDTTIGQYTIKKGTIIQVDIYSIHFDVDLWGPVDPYKFYPERHEIKRHPLAYLSFGAGPRNCIAMRFALIEMKMACVRLFKTFAVQATDKLENNFQIIDCNTIKPEAVWIKVQHRKKAS